MEMETTTTTYIADDILVRILSWLPANTLIRLRWACKYWLDLITRDTDFIKFHFQHRSTIQLPTATVLMLNNTPPGYVSRGTNNKYTELIQCYLSRSSVSPHERISYPFQSLSGFVCLDSCNGLLLCFHHSSYTMNSSYTMRSFIWNPCTQEYKVLPVPPPSPKGFVEWSSGFAYDPTLDDYIVTRSGKTHLSYYFQVYMLGTNSWKTIEIGPQPPICPFYSRVFVNGCFYWNDSSGKRMFFFYIGKEKYQEESIEQFCYDVNLNLYDMKFQVFEGSLCLVQVFQREGEYSVQMWVMEKDKGSANESGRTSWTQLFTTPISLGRCNYRIEPLMRFSKSGEILLLKRRKNNQLVLYDPKSDATMDFNGFRMGKTHTYLIELYIENLVSLNSGTYAESNKSLVSLNSGTCVERKKQRKI